VTETIYTHRRHEGVICFYDASKRRIGPQALGNRLKETFEKITEPIMLKESDTGLRVKLKRSLGMANGQNPDDGIGQHFN
jgi:hypothetical protein